MEKKTLMKDGRMKKVQMMVQLKLTCVERNSERNTSQKINYEQQLLDILKEKSENNDEDKTFLLSLVQGFKKLEDGQKYWAKMEMLGIMRRAKNMVFQPQYAEL